MQRIAVCLLLACAAVGCDDEDACKDECAKRFPERGSERARCELDCAERGFSELLEGEPP